MPRDPGRCDAIEGIDAHLHAFPNIANTTDTEEMDRAIATQRLHRIAYHVVHLVFLRAEATADRVPEEGTGRNEFGAFPAQLFIDAALHYTIKRLAAIMAAFELGKAAVRPTLGQRQRIRRIFPVDVIGRAFVQDDNKVGAELSLNLDGSFGRQGMAGPIAR